MNMKTIGVLGGLGPQAPMDFEARVHAVARQMPGEDAGAPDLINPAALLADAVVRHAIGSPGRQRPCQPQRQPR